jgi:hypothetical protein
MYLIHYGNLIGIHRVMQVAVKEGVAGTGKHTWIHSKSLPEHIFNSTEIGSSLHKAYMGTGLFGANGSGGDSIYDSFRKQLQWMKKNPDETVSYFKLMEGQFHSNRTTVQSDLPTELLEDDTFLRDTPVRDFSPYHYESAILTGMAACSTASTTLILNGKQFYQEVRNTNFSGISGHVVLDKDTGTRRAETSYFTMDNLVEQRYFEDEKVAKNGTLSEEVRFKFVTADRLYNSNWTEIAPFIYNDNNTTPPLCIPKYDPDPTAVKTVTVVVAYLICATSILLAVGLAI